MYGYRYSGSGRFRSLAVTTLAATTALALGQPALTAFGQAGAGNGTSAAGTAASGAATSPGTGSTGMGATGAVGSAGIGTANGMQSGTTTGAGQMGQGSNGVASSTSSVSSTSQGNGSVSGGSQSGGSVSAQAAGSLPLAGTPSRSVYDLGQTIAAAIASSSDLQVAARNVRIDRVRSDEAAAAGKPSISANGQATRFDKATVISIGGGPPIQVVPSHTELLSINLAERLDITGQIRAASDQARLQSLADQFTYEYLRDQRILRAKTIYFDLLRAEHQVQVANSSLITAQRQLLDAQNLNNAQVGQKIDVYRAATQVANAQQQLTAAQNNLDISRADFNDLVGRPLAEPVAAVDVPGVNVGVDVSDTKGVGAATELIPHPIPRRAAGGQWHRPRCQPEYGVCAERPRYSPIRSTSVLPDRSHTRSCGAGADAHFDAAGNYYPTTSFQNPRKRTALVTATLNIPLYDSGLTRDRVEEARLRTQNAQTALGVDERSDVALDVRQSYLNLQTAARQIDAANTALQQAIAARQLAQVRYRGQVGTYLEVTDAQSALVQAENSQVDAVYNYLVAKAQFENSSGMPQTQ